MEYSTVVTLEDLSNSLLEMKDALKSLTDRFESHCGAWSTIAESLVGTNHNVGIAKEMLEELSREVKFARTDCQNNYQYLASKLNESPNVVVWNQQESAGNCNIASYSYNTQSQGHGQTFNIPNSASFCENESGEGVVNQVNATVIHSAPVSYTVAPTTVNQVEKEKAVPGPHQQHDIQYARLTGNESELGNVNRRNICNDPNLSKNMLGLNQMHPHSVVRFENDPNANSVVPVANKYGVPKSNGLSIRQFPIKSTKLRLICPYCRREFEHKHSIVLHIKSCKKKHMGIKKESQHDQAFQQPSTSNFSNVCAVTAELDNNVCRKEEKMIKCGYCERSFPTSHQVKSHERVHTGKRPYSCYICGITFAHQGNMIKHIKSKHPKENPYVCRQCKCNFKTHADVMVHRKVCVPPKAPNEAIKESRASIAKKICQSGGDSEDTQTASEDEGSSRDFTTLTQSGYDMKAVKTESQEQTSVDSSNIENVTAEAANNNMSNQNTTRASQVYPNASVNTVDDVPGFGQMKIEVCDTSCSETEVHFEVIDVKQQIEFQPD